LFQQILSYQVSQFSLSSLLTSLPEWNTPYQLPPFSLIQPSHYKPAFLDHAFPQHLNELKQIVELTDPPTFENTILPYDQSGSLYHKIYNLFSNQCLSECPTELQIIQLELSGPLAEHENAIITFPGLFMKISYLYQNREHLNLNCEQNRLIETIYLDFIQKGAQFDSTSLVGRRYKEIVMELAILQTQFAQNVLADESNYFLELHMNELDGLPEDLIAAASQAAIDRKKPIGSYGITLSRSLVEPFLTYSSHRNKREEAWRAWINR
jgi:peptidyl-dipeptidase Dcp